MFTCSYSPVGKVVGVRVLQFTDESIAVTKPVSDYETSHEQKITACAANTNFYTKYYSVWLGVRLPP